MSRTNCAIGKDYVPASFKGVGFYATEADVEGGRRGAEGEFPFGEDTAYADLGRKIRVYHLTAVFREDDHVSDSAALFAVCESPGPGILVHPTRGTVLVACRQCKVSDKLEEGQGETTAELEFVEANPVGTGLGIGSLFGIISSGLATASQAVFYANYKPGQVAQPWSKDVVDTAQNLVDVTRRAWAQTFIAEAWQKEEIAQIEAQISANEARMALFAEAVANDDGLAVSAVNVDTAETQMMNMISSVQSSDVKFKVFRGLVNAAGRSSNLPVSGGAAASEEAMLSRHRILAAIGMAEAAMGRTYAYVDLALQAKDMVVEVLESEAQAAYANCDNGLFLELRKYATEFSKMMHDLAYRLPGLIIVDFMGGVHPLVASYAVYGNAKRHRDLEARNRVDANGRFMAVISGVAPQ